MRDKALALRRLGKRVLSAFHKLQRAAGRIGPGVRLLFGLYLLASGVGYLVFVWVGGRLTTTYQVQASYAPLWSYGIVLLVLGIWLLATWRIRNKLAGRIVPGVTLVAISFIIGTWIESGAWTGTLTYMVHILACIIEVGFVDEGTPHAP